MNKRVFLIVLDSLGIGEMPDSYLFKDEGSNTLKAIRNSVEFNCPNLESLGLFNIDNVGGGIKNPKASFGRVKELSKGKDTIIGHWEIAGIVSNSDMPTYPNGFPDDIIKEFEEKTGKKVLCNKPYSGTEVIKDFGNEHLKTGDLIVYTSQDSVFQIAAHEEKVSVNKLYKYCEIARQILVGKHAVGRVIARPFSGEYPFFRTANRKDFSLNPPKKSMLNYLVEKGFKVLSVGKIEDIFNNYGITKGVHTVSNDDGIDKTLDFLNENFSGLCFVNLVDFDSKYGHRNDISGYAKALSNFDKRLKEILIKLNKGDILIITADHGCDPSTISTDHSREYVPLLVYGESIKEGVNLKTLSTFSDISATILDYFKVESENLCGESFLNKILK